MTVRRALLVRFLLAVGVGLLLAGVFSELAFRFQGNTTSRQPKTVRIVIPAGAGQDASQGRSSLPQDMVFVVGDTLEVENQDTVAHSLGPLFVPSGSTASLLLSQTGDLAYSCSFAPTQILGLNVQPALTIGIRVQGILLAGIPMGLLMGLYSLILWPLKGK
jgi:hypothetical protein